MRVPGAHLAVVAVAIAVAGAGGCRRTPLADATDGRADQAADVGGAGGRGDGGIDAALDAVRDVADAMADSGPDDAPGVETTPDTPPGDASGEMPGDRQPTDTPADVATNDTSIDTPVDTPIDTADNDTPADVPDRDGPPDRASDAGSDVRPDDQPCGPQGFLCAPFACDVARGICKNFCTSDDDCITGKRCVAGLCGFREELACTSNNECLSGHCAQGVCCNSDCNQVCHSCALLGTLGGCSPIPRGGRETFDRCGDGGTCNGRGGCVPGSCATDTDCGDLYLCENARCVPCNATCASTPDCIAGAICVMRNFCTWCAIADAGAGQ